MLSDLTQQSLVLLGGWLVVAIIAVAALYIVLKVVGKAISASLRLAIILGALVVITIALFVLSRLLDVGKLPIP